MIKKIIELKDQVVKSIPKIKTEHLDHYKELIRKIIAMIIIKPTDTEEEKSKKIIWYTFVGSIITLFIISWIIFVLLTFNNDSVKVPMIEGDNVYIALKKLYERRLVANPTTKYSDTIKQSNVYSQSPKSGTSVKRGRVISFNVSLGDRSLALPDFRGFNLFELDDFLNSKYSGQKIPYDLETPVYEYNLDVEKGRIFKQFPEEGTPIYKVKRVKLWISNGIKQEGAGLLKNYVGRNIEEVSGELTEQEILYSYVFEPIKDKQNDMVIIEQSIGEGKPINELIEENKVLMFKVNQYQYINNEKIKGTYLLDVPKKPLPFLVEVKIKTDNAKEKTIFKRKTKGGVSLPIPYSTKKNSKLLVYYDNVYINELSLIVEESEPIQ